MSNRARREHTRALRRRLLPGPPTIGLRLRFGPFPDLIDRAANRQGMTRAEFVARLLASAERTAVTIVTGYPRDRQVRRG